MQILRALRDVNLQKRKEAWRKKKEKKNNKRIQQEINVLLITAKTMYDQTNFAPFHKNEPKIPVSHEGNCVL